MESAPGMKAVARPVRESELYMLNILNRLIQNKKAFTLRPVLRSLKSVGGSRTRKQFGEVGFTLRSYTRKVCSEVGQTLSEYAIVIGLVTAALLSMQPFIRRSVQAILKGSADELGNQQAEETLPVFGTKETSYYKTETKSATNEFWVAGLMRRIEETEATKSGNIVREERID